MPYSSKAVANEILHLAKDEGRTVTPMQLLKLVYFAYGWYWVFENQPLFDERIQAWKYGPVVPSLYHEFKSYGNEPITSFASEWEPVHTAGKFAIRFIEPRIPEGDDFPHKLIQRVWQVYKKYSAVQLSRMTHEPGTPWAETANREAKGTSIEDEKIKAYFQQLAKQNDRTRAAGD